MEYCQSQNRIWILIKSTLDPDPCLSDADLQHWRVTAMLTKYLDLDAGLTMLDDREQM